MNGKELKRLSRRELVDIIYQLKKNEQEMQEENAALKAALQDKRIRISNCGSIADAAVSVTDLLATAQSTADLYLQEIAEMKEKTQKECDQKIAETEQKVKEILADSEKKMRDLFLLYQTQNEESRQEEFRFFQPEQGKIRQWYGDMSDVE